VDKARRGLRIVELAAVKTVRKVQSRHTRKAVVAMAARVVAGWSSVLLESIRASYTVERFCPASLFTISGDAELAIIVE
jgi:hypothetical protein